MSDIINKIFEAGNNYWKKKINEGYEEESSKYYTNKPIDEGMYELKKKIYEDTPHETKKNAQNNKVNHLEDYVEKMLEDGDLPSTISVSPDGIGWKVTIDTTTIGPIAGKVKKNKKVEDWPGGPTGEIGMTVPNAEQSKNSGVIGMLLGDGRVVWVRVDVNFNPQYAGKILLEYYDHPQKIIHLLQQGRIVCLGQEIGNKHDVDDHIKEMTTFWHRDGGKELEINIATGMSAFLGDTEGAIFTYVYDTHKNEWNYSVGHGEFIDLNLNDPIFAPTEV